MCQNHSKHHSFPKGVKCVSDPEEGPWVLYSDVEVRSSPLPLNGAVEPQPETLTCWLTTSFRLQHRKTRQRPFSFHGQPLPVGQPVGFSIFPRPCLGT